MSKRSRRSYSDEFKKEVVKLITEQGYKASEAARNLDINESMLRRWKQELAPEADGALDTDDKDELQRLRKENQKLRMEREILKKGSREAARRDVIDYILMFYNNQRLHSTLGYRSPAYFEAEYQDSQNVA